MYLGYSYLKSYGVMYVFITLVIRICHNIVLLRGPVGYNNSYLGFLMCQSKYIYLGDSYLLWSNDVTVKYIT